MKWPSFQSIYLFILIMTCILLVVALYVEFNLGIHPCPLCVLQRFAFGGIAIVALFATIHCHPRCLGRIFYAIFTVLFSMLGMCLSSRQIWLQHQPLDPNNPCLPGLTYLIKTFSFCHGLMLALRGTIDCGRVDWVLCGFSMAEWAFLFFAFFAILSLIAIRNRK